MARGGIEYLFFTSGSEIGFYQEAISKAHALGRPAPKLITVNHEHAGLNAALGYAAVSGKPAATAVHVDTGTLHNGGGIHTAMQACLPVLLTAGFPPTSYPGSSPAGRNSGAHLWLQQSFDQCLIVDAAVHEMEMGIALTTVEIVLVTGIGERIQHHYGIACMLLQPVMHKITADEAGTAGDQ